MKTIATVVAIAFSQLYCSADDSISVSRHKVYADVDSNAVSIGGFDGDMDDDIDDILSSVDEVKSNEAEKPKIYYSLRGIPVRVPRKGEMYIVDGVKILKQ